MIAYIVTSGSYSDYSIEAVFLKKRDAEIFIHNCYTDLDDPEIEEYEIGENIKKKRPFWKGSMDRDGNIRSIRKSSNTDDEYIRFEFYLLKEYTYISFSIDAKSEKHAIKIINEKRAQVVAIGMWDDPTAFSNYEHLIGVGGRIELK